MKMLLFYVCIYWYISCLRALQTSSSSRCKQLKKIADFYFFHRLSLSFSIWINAKCVSVIRRWHCSDIKAICQNAQKSVWVFVRWAKQFPAKRRKVLIRKTVFISLTSHIIDATLNLKCWHCNIIPLRYWDFSASSPPPRTLTWSLAIWRKKEKKIDVIECENLLTEKSHIISQSCRMYEGNLILSRRRSHIILIYTSFAHSHALAHCCNIVTWKECRQKFAAYTSCNQIIFKPSHQQLIGAFYLSPINVNYARLIWLMACWVIYRNFLSTEKVASYLPQNQ